MAGDEPPQPPDRTLADRIARRRTAAIAGHVGDVATARELVDDRDASVRATAVGALSRLGELRLTDAQRAAADPEPAVRRRLAEELGRRPSDDEAIQAIIIQLLGDEDASVVESAAWAAGECFEPPGEPTAADEARPVGPMSRLVVERLAAVATNHGDPLAREAAVAALGAIGLPEGLAAVRAGLRDKPAIRRRAVLALAAFDADDVEADLRAAMGDRDWQVRQAAEDLLGERDH